MDILKFKEMLAGLENGEELLEFFQSHDNTLRKDIEKAKAKKGEVITEKQEIDRSLKELLSTLQAGTKEEALKKIEEFGTQLSEMKGNFENLSKSFEEEQKEKEKAKKEAENATLLSEITKSISDKKLKDGKGLLQTAIFHKAVKDADSGQYLVKEGDETISISDYLQSIVDSEEPLFTEKTKEDRPPADNIDLSKTNQAREAMGLPPKS